MSNTSTYARRDSGQGLLGVLALVIGGMGLAKFLGLMVLHGPAQSPWMFLLVLVIPFLVGRLLLPSHPRVAATVIGVFAALLSVICAATVILGIEPYWADYLLVFIGGPLAVVTVALAVRVLRTR